MAVRTDVLEALRAEVYRRCRAPENRFGMGCYDHIEAVVRNGKLLAERYGADVEVVMIAAWLHDIASVTDEALYEMHHIHGAEMAREILTKLSYDIEKIPLVQACIRNHRGSVRAEKASAEERCVADADAIAHFDCVPGLLYLAYVQKGMDVAEGARFVRAKLERSFGKLSAESRAFYEEKYRQVMGVLGDAVIHGEPVHR